jgi:hypothetical protein
MEMVIAKLYKLAQIRNKYSLDHKELSRSKAIVERQYAENQNENYLNGGLWYEIDEKATKEFHQIIEEKVQKLAKLKELKDISNTNLLGGALAEVVENHVKKGRKPKD